MSARGTHEAAARINAVLAQRHDRAGSQERPWVPTFLFYARVQLVECALADQGEHPSQHGDREALVALQWRSGSASYRQLKQLSEYWRYRGRQPSDTELRNAWAWAQELAAAVREPWPEQNP